MKSASSIFKLISLSPQVYALHFETDEASHIIERYHRLKACLKGVEDMVLTFNRISIFFKEHKNKREVEKLLSGIDLTVVDTNQIRREWELPICFDEIFTNDLEAYFSKDEAKIARYRETFLGTSFQLAFYGFLPGFPYLSGLRESLCLDRKKQPKKQIQKGSVAVGGSQVGIYPQASPGGWQCLGNCPVPLLTTETSNPTWIAVGDRIRFHAISLKEYHQIALDVDQGIYQPKTVEP